MQFRALLVLLLSATFVHASGFFVLIKSKIINNSSYPVDVLCQVTRPVVECYGEGCLWGAWPVRKIAPGQTVPVDLWITSDDESRMVLSLFAALEDGQEVDADRYLLKHMSKGKPLLGEVSLEYNLAEGGLFVTHNTQNVDCRLARKNAEYQMEINVS
ncbi:MAG: hypothetical protein VXW87_01240 [Pseudomonadota bacterium]|nr:hypothetical protein [Pseudomonadota bacterium]